MSDTELLNCPECDSGDVAFDEVSVSPCCNECKYWGAINYVGTKQDAIDAWNKKKREVEETIDKLFVDADNAIAGDADEIVDTLFPDDPKESEIGFFKNIQENFKKVVDELEITAEAQGISSISMGEDVGWITGPHDAIKAVQELIIDGEEYRKKIRELESKREYDIDKAVIEDLRKENREIKDLFVDLTFCYLNPEITKTMYAEVNRQFKEIVGDDPEFTTNTESESL